MSKLGQYFNEVREVLEEARYIRSGDVQSTLSARLSDNLKTKDTFEKFCENSSDPDYNVARYFIDLLQRIDYASKEDQAKNAELFTISLGDMKALHAFIDIIVIGFIYPYLPPGIGIPIERRLRGTPPNLGTRSSGQLDTLRLVVDSVLEIVQSEDDVADIIMGGQYSTDIISGLLVLGFDPTNTNDDKYIYVEKFDKFVSRIDTYTLIGYLTMFTHKATPQWCLEIVTRMLATLPITRQTDGVKSLIEFIGGLREDEHVAVEKLDRAARVLCSIPKGVQSSVYFAHVGKQILSILENANQKLLVSSTVQVVAIMKKSRPKAVVDFVFRPLITSFIPNIDTVQPDGVLVSDLELSKRMTQLLNLVRNSEKDVIEEILSPVFYSLWALACFQLRTKRAHDDSKSLLLVYIKSGETVKKLDLLVQHIFYDGEAHWRFGSGCHGQIEIRKHGTSYTELATEESLRAGLDGIENLDQRVEFIFQLMSDLDKTIVQAIFVLTVRRWLSKRQNPECEPFEIFVDIRLLEMILEKRKADVVDSPSEIISLVSSILDEYITSLKDRSQLNDESKPLSARLADIVLDHSSDDDSDDENEEQEQAETDLEAVSVAISLLSAIISESLVSGSSSISEDDKRIIKSFGPSLRYIAAHGPANVSSSASTLAMLLDDTEIPLSNAYSHLNQSQQQYQQAIVNLKDPLVPIRAQGLHQLRSLILSKDPVINVDKVLQNYFSLLNDEDSFVYLNCIKGLEALTDAYGIIVIKRLIDRYTAKSKSPDLDERLRIGEAILRTVQRLGEAFTGTNAEVIARAMIQTIANNRNDTRLRSSALSILGMACEVNPLGLGAWAKDAIDCALGVLTFETDDEKVILRRAAVVLIGSLLKGIQHLQDFPKEAAHEVTRTMRYIQSVDQDALVRVQAGNVLDIVGDMIAQELTM